MIHDLSYRIRDPELKGVNQYILESKKTVQYSSFDDAVSLVCEQGEDCWMAKSDLDSAFHRIPMDFDSLQCLGIKINGNYYIDCLLPFGSGTSCFLFEQVSSAIEWVVKHQTKIKSSHYLDNFFFIHKCQNKCLRVLKEFFSVCDFIGFPISMEKTFLPTRLIDYLGIEIDMVKMVLRVPDHKKQKAVKLINELLSKRKCHVKEMQHLCGVLAFLCKVVRPGHCFQKRMYNTLKGIPQHHHIKVTMGTKKDMNMWLQFFNEVLEAHTFL